MEKKFELLFSPLGLVIIGASLLAVLLAIAYASKVSFLVVGYSVLITLVLLVVYMVFRLTHPKTVDRILERFTDRQNSSK